MVPILKGKGDIRNCSCHEGGGNGVIKRLHRIVTVDEVLFALCLRGTIDAVFMLRMLQEE